MKQVTLLKWVLIDPMKVTKQALQNAVSVAVTILSTNAIVTWLELMKQSR